MMTINWEQEVLKRKEQMIADIQQFLQIKSVLDEENVKEGAPFGEGIQKALLHLLEKGSKDGFTPKNLDGYAGHLEFGEGDELLGILCHVDVVPEGDGWTSDPYSAEIRDGKIYARGAIDDKGPTMAAYYAMKIVKELNLPLSKRVRMIIGTDEESQWRCVDHYFKHEEMPTLGFAPDADFPIINAEKGICDFYLQKTNETSDSFGEDGKLVSFQSGRRLNMVPDFAEATVHTKNSQLQTQFDQFLSQHSMKGNCFVEGEVYKFELEGVSAHGMEPNNGINAGLKLVKFLAEAKLDENGMNFITLINDYFVEESRGRAVGVAVEDEISGPLTMNIGVLSYSEEKINIGINMRSPVTHDVEPTKTTIANLGEEHGYKMSIVSEMKPHYVAENHPLVQTLSKVYEERTGEKANLIAIGGGTYARSLEAGVAFGPMFPGSEDVAHQKDEYVIIDDLLKATAIYAQAIYELTK
jgi:succinyl-diaminopimelate desuccinylase